LEHESTCVSAPWPLNAIANCPLRPTTAGHPHSQRAPQSGFSFLDSDTTRWRKWIISRACPSGDWRARNIALFLLTWNPSRHMKPILAKKTSGSGQETGRMHSHDPWAGGRTAGFVIWSMSRLAFLRPEAAPDPLKRAERNRKLPPTAHHCWPSTQPEGP
jgi:hypothetical protein